MAQNIIRNEDFKSGSVLNNIRGIIYQGNGTPVNRVSASNAGAIYIDNYTGQLWVCLGSGTPATWQPYFTDIITNIRIDNDVQEGDLVGIYGAGSWTNSVNTTISRNFLSAAGSQNAGVVCGGQDAAGTIVSMTELFNGSTWTTSGNLVSPGIWDAPAIGSEVSTLIAGGGTAPLTPSQKTAATQAFNGSTWTNANASLSDRKTQLAGSGTGSAAFVTGGVTISGARTRATELYNGASWSLSGQIALAKSGPGAVAGSVNAGLLGGGFATTGTSNTELFNGGVWSSSGFTVSNTRYTLAGGGTQNSAWMAGGVFSPTDSELFNGSTWSASGVLNFGRANGAGLGSQLAGMIAGGSGAGGFFNSTEVHNQITYRKVSYSSSQDATNIGLAYNTSNTSLTASVMRGDLPTTYVTPNTFFGVSRFNNLDNNIFVSSNTATISSITTVGTNQATLNLSASLTTGFAVGSILLISNGTKVPIIGGTIAAPIVRWENVSSSASTSLTVGCIWGHRITYSAMNITSSGTTATVTQTATLQYSKSYKGRVGDLLMIPYSSPSGSSGSSIFYGSYQITNVTYPATDIVAYTITLPASVNNTSDANIGGITLLQQIVCNSSVLSAEDVILGYRNKMRAPAGYPLQDDLSTGLI